MDKLKGTLHYEGAFKKDFEKVHWRVERIVAKDMPAICDIEDDVMLQQIELYEELCHQLASLRSDDVACVLEFVKQYRTDASATMKAIGIEEG